MLQISDSIQIAPYIVKITRRDDKEKRKKSTRKSMQSWVALAIKNSNHYNFFKINNRKD